tara:strand:+ start:98 stop:535 length:438 start_codon:yes stop_codon:yes gene_type:complete
MSCVYRIECLDKSIPEFYIGSTRNLKQRTKQHKCDCNNSNRINHNIKIYEFIRKNGGWDNWKIDIELLTTGMERKDRKQLEQNYLDCLKPELNSYNAVGDKKEYEKQYYQNNKEKILNENKVKINCSVCNKLITKGNMKRHLKLH